MTRVLDRAVPTVTGDHPPALPAGVADLFVTVERVAIDQYVWDDFTAHWDENTGETPGTPGTSPLADYTAAVLADTPVGFWLLNEPTGTLEDHSGLGRHLTITDGTRSTDCPVEDGEGSFQFDGSNDQLFAADHNDWSSTALTVEVWFKFLSTAAVGYLMAHSTASTTDQEWTLANLIGGQIRFTLKNTSQTTYRSATIAAITDTDWHHLVITYDTGVFVCYLDGASVAFTPAGPSGSRATNRAIPLTIGALTSTPRTPMNGHLFGVAYYTAALSATRVAAHYAAGIAPVIPPGPPIPGDYLWFWDNPATVASDRLDVTCDLAGLTIEAGGPDPEAQFDAGRCAFTLVNREGQWSQYDSQGRLVDFLIGRAVDVWAEIDGEPWWLFSGGITRWSERADGLVDVEAFDAFSALNAHIGTWDPSPEGHYPAERLEHICDLIGFDGPRRFDFGEVTLIGHDTDRTPLEEMQIVSASDGGVLVVDADGTLLYRDRLWRGGRADQTAVPVLSDNVCPGPITVWDPELVTDDVGLVNKITLTNIASAPVKVDAVDQDSVDLHGPHTWPESRDEDQWITMEEGQRLADFLVSQRANAYLRVQQFLLHLHGPQEGLWLHGIDLRLGDVIEFVHEQPATTGAQVLDLYLVVSSISHEVTMRGPGVAPAWITTVGTTRTIGNRPATFWDDTEFLWDQDDEPLNVWSW